MGTGEMLTAINRCINQSSTSDRGDYTPTFGPQFSSNFNGKYLGLNYGSYYNTANHLLPFILNPMVHGGLSANPISD